MELVPFGHRQARPDPDEVHLCIITREDPTQTHGPWKQLVTIT